jgi:hypothetical protein
MFVIRSLDFAARVLGVAALALGLTLWNGQLYALVNLHMALGALVVLILWLFAYLTFRRRGSRFLALSSLAWGAATLTLGIFQPRLLAGNYQ